MSLRIVPVTLKDAQAFVALHHRHVGKVVGHVCCMAVADETGIRGVALVGRPVARALQDGFTAEVNRCCTDGAPNACSMLYGACWRAARALGYTRLVTYTRASEPGTSLRAAGWRVVGETSARSSGWDCPSRPREGGATVPKIRWEAA